MHSSTHMYVRFVFVFCKMLLSFATSMARLFLTALLGVLRGLQTHPCLHEKLWWGSPMGTMDMVGIAQLGSGSPARCCHLTKQQAAVLQTKQKWNKNMFGKVQGSSRSFFRLLSLPHSLLRAKQNTSTKWVFISCQTQNWCVIYPSEGNPAKNDRFPPSPQAEHVPWAEHQGFCSLGSAWALAATNPTEPKDFKPLLEKVSCLLFCLVPSPAGMLHHLSAAGAARLTHTMQNVL